MKIGFIKRSWHDPGKVVPTVAYRMYDEDNSFYENPYLRATHPFKKALDLVRELGIKNTAHDHIRVEHMQAVIAALRLAGYEVGDYPK